MLPLIGTGYARGVTMAARRLSTFLLHYWSLDDGAARVVLEHIQSGERAVCPTLAAATEWVRARTVVAAAEGIAPTDPGSGVPDVRREEGR
jgi:hypothetical protein